jgi:hypothetical protein
MGLQVPCRFRSSTALGPRLFGIDRQVRTGAGPNVHPRAGSFGWSSQKVLNHPIRRASRDAESPLPNRLLGGETHQATRSAGVSDLGAKACTLRRWERRIERATETTSQRAGAAGMVTAAHSRKATQVCREEDVSGALRNQRHVQSSLLIRARSPARFLTAKATLMACTLSRWHPPFPRPRLHSTPYLLE